MVRRSIVEWWSARFSWIREWWQHVPLECNFLRFRWHALRSKIEFDIFTRIIHRVAHSKHKWNFQLISQPTHRQWSLSHLCGTQIVRQIAFLIHILFIVYANGDVCISILHKMDDPLYEHEGEERWRPILGVESIILSVISMLNDPNTDSPANLDASLQFRDNR